MKDGLIYQFINQMAVIACKKDNGEVLKKTISKNIIKGINAAEDCSLRVVFDEEKNKWDVQIKKMLVQRKLCGDLAYLFMIFGKEQYETNLREQRTGRDCMGVRAKPYFKFKVPIERVVWQVLCALISVGGANLDYIIDYGEKYIQCCS